MLVRVRLTQSTWWIMQFYLLRWYTLYMLKFSINWLQIMISLGICSRQYNSPSILHHWGSLRVFINSKGLQHSQIISKGHSCKPIYWLPAQHLLDAAAAHILFQAWYLDDCFLEGNQSSVVCGFTKGDQPIPWPSRSVEHCKCEQKWHHHIPPATFWHPTCPHWELSLLCQLYCFQVSRDCK